MNQLASLYLRVPNNARKVTHPQEIARMASNKDHQLNGSPYARNVGSLECSIPRHSDA